MRKVDLEGLLNALVPHAEKQLAEYGDFFPYAGVMRQDGNLESVMPEMREGAFNLDAWRDALVDRLRQGARAGRYRATGLVLNVEMDVPGSDRVRAIRVALEHETGVGYDVYIPYWFEGPGVSYGSAMAAEGSCQVFAYCAEPEPVPLASALTP